MNIKLLFCFKFIIILFSASPVFAADYFGRFSLGSFASTERFSSSDFGSDKNDHLNYSGRFYLRVTDIGAGKWDFVSDLRDKFDQFDTLNKTKLQLDPKNYYQTRQLFTSNFQSRTPLNFMFGRFSLIESGGTYTDGLATQYRTSASHRLGLFGGFNPLEQGQFIVTSNEKAKIYGIYSYYEPANQIFSQNFSLSHAYVSQLYDSEEDRRYFFQSIYYQWDSLSRFTSNIYLDFVPRTFVQNASLNWDQSWNTNNISHVNFLAVDTIQYRRIQGIRETLEPSPYQQFRLQWDFAPIRRVAFSPIYTEGKRAIDGLSRKETRLRAALGGYLNSQYDLNLYGGVRKNFITDDQFFGFSAGYYSAKWEFVVDAESSTEEPTPNTPANSQTNTLHATIINLSTSFIQNKNLFYSFALESAKDENVQVLMMFFKLTHRFGSKYTPPLRDGAPTRGTL